MAATTSTTIIIPDHIPALKMPSIAAQLDNSKVAKVNRVIGISLFI